MGITSYAVDLDYQLGAVLSVYYRNQAREIVDYSLVLLFNLEGCTETIRVYDSAHGFNEMHRYTRVGGKQNGVVFSGGNLGEGMRAAIKDIRERYLAMIEGWEG